VRPFAVRAGFQSFANTTMGPLSGCAPVHIGRRCTTRLVHQRELVRGAWPSEIAVSGRVDLAGIA
jgi:hypothetical protein